MKKYTLLAIPALCLLLLAGCGEKPQPPSDNTEKTASTEQSVTAGKETEAETEAAQEVRTTANDNVTVRSENASVTSADISAEEADIAFLRSCINSDGSVVGIGFLGYIDSESDSSAVKKFVSDSVLAKNYAFLNGCTPVLTEGAEMYAFVPRSDKTTVTVYRAEMTENGTYSDLKDTPIYVGKAGETVVLRCNLSEIYSNVLVSVTDGTRTAEFHPMLSMMDGHIAVEKGCYDFSVYTTDADEAVEAARSVIEATDEVSDAMKSGMTLLQTGDTVTVDGNECVVFALGTDNGDSFVRERIYAVSGGTVYSYDVVSDAWQILGAG